MVLDHGRVQPNPARDKLTVKMPREERRELQPPTAAHVEAVVRLLPRQYRLPALVRLALCREAAGVEPRALPAAEPVDDAEANRA